MTAEMITTLLVMAVLMMVSMAVILRPIMQDLPNIPQSLRPVISITLLVALLASLGLYGYYGSFGLADNPLNQRNEEIAAVDAEKDNAESENFIAFQAAQTAAQARPQDLEAQFKLADAAAVAGHSDVEIETLEKILVLTGNPLIKSMIGEALTRQAGGIVTTRALELIEEGLAERPDDWRGRYLKGLYISQSGDDMGALGLWAPLAEDLNGSEIYPAIEAAIQEASARIGVDAQTFLPAPLPSAADITDMVLGLEAELQQAGVEGERERWLMLVRSLVNLGEPERRDAAIGQYLKLMPRTQDDIPILLGFTELLLPLDQLPNTMPEILNPLLSSAREINADNHGVLFFSGLVARSNGDRESVETYWQKLLTQLAPENPLYDLLSQELNKN